MKKLIISSIVAFSLYSCSTTKPVIEKDKCCNTRYVHIQDNSKSKQGYHIHLETAKLDGATVLLKIDNKVKCPLCKQSLK